MKDSCSIAMFDSEGLLYEQPSITVTVSRRFKASPDRVFDASLDPQKPPQFLLTEHLNHRDCDDGIGNGPAYSDNAMSLG
jgi:hypothetical protein